MSQEALVFGFDEVMKAIPPEAAIERVRDGFVRHARGEWTMPPKVYLESPPHGDFRAMPAGGGGYAILKWVTSFPGNRAKDLPVVVGTILVSDAVTGRWTALIDGTAVTALRTGAAAAVATQALARAGASTAGVIGCGLHGRWAALCLKAAGFTSGVCADVDDARARAVADELGWRAGTAADALETDIVTLVTPGHEPVVTERHLRAGMHLNALGADGPGKAELTVDAVTACRLFCDEWAQASHGGELTGAADQGLIDRDRVTELGRVLTGEVTGRPDDTSVTLFDSTGLAIQDLALAIAVMDAHVEGLEPAGTVVL